MKKCILLLLICLLLIGCSKDKNEVINPITEEELIAFIKEDMKKRNGSNVEVSIESKETYYHCLIGMDDTCYSKIPIKDAYIYHIIIDNINGHRQSTTATFIDSYQVKDKKDKYKKYERIFVID